MAAHAGANNVHTRKIAEFVSGLTYEQIPAEVRERIKLLILDSLGCAIYGANLEWCRILRGTLEALDATRTTSIWGTDRKLSSPHAALLNGTQVQGFELDDVHRKAVLHVGAVTLPALIAVAESHAQLSGRDLLTSAVAGYEIGPRVGLCMGQEHIGQGWHSGATVGIFSAAAGAARGLKLDADKTVHALGIAGTQSSGLMAAQYGAMVKRMHAGRAAQSGLYGALLARDGFTGIVDVFEAPYGGFCTTFSRSNDRFNLEELSAGLGERFETMRISLKFYSCVGSNHTTLDAIRDIRKRRLAGHGRSRRLAVPAGRPDLGTAQPAVLRRHAADRGRRVRRRVHRRLRRRRGAHKTVAQGEGGARSRHHRARRRLSAQGARRYPFPRRFLRKRNPRAPTTSSANSAS
jgi:2-methylcitrate dehydratase PrpD